MTKHALNINIPQWTHTQLEDLKREQGTTKTQIVITAVDHYKREGQGYNGWTNYETWCVSLWLNNEPGTYHALNAILENEPDDYDASKLIKDWVEEMNPLANASSMFSDLLSAALRDVDWQEIAKSNRED
jgi:hypothetical protein